jgi:benzylsuccinate CoA-transferase BbsF subunit
MTNESPRKPLEGIRVIDFTVVWAGTFATLLLADLGAEVIKVENVRHWQPMTRGGVAHPPESMMQGEAAWATGYPNNEPGPRPWNYCPTFVQLYRNKRSVTIDATTPEGKDLVRRLVAETDVFVENNAVGTIDKLGFDFDELRKAKDDIIMVRAPGYGMTGPYKDARTLGVHLESVMGHTLLRGYRDLDPSHTTAIFSGDYMAGAQGAFAIMAALRHRRKTGHGQLIEIPQAEAASPMLAQAFMEYALNKRIPAVVGNRSIYGFAPSNTYPCLSPGDGFDGGDRWISIAVTNEDEWAALRQVMGDPEWAQSSDFATAAARIANQDALDEHVAAWTSDRDDYELFHQLQAAGVAAAPVLEASRIFDDAHVKARGLNRPRTLHDEVGTFDFNTPFFNFPETPVGDPRPSVALGQDNEYVYKEVIGVSDEEYDALQAAGALGMDYDETIA